MSKVKRSLSLKDFYRSYKAYCKNKGLQPEPYPVYRNVMKTMGAQMSNILLKEGIVGLPRMIGDVFFKKDNKKNVIKRKEHYEFNEHTDGFPYHLFWLSPERMDKKRRLWCFSGYRDMKRTSAELFKSKQAQYPDFKMMNPRAMSK